MGLHQRLELSHGPPQSYGPIHADLSWGLRTALVVNGFPVPRSRSGALAAGQGLIDSHLMIRFCDIYSIDSAKEMKQTFTFNLPPGPPLRYAATKKRILDRASWTNINPNRKTIVLFLECDIVYKFDR